MWDIFSPGDQFFFFKTCRYYPDLSLRIFLGCVSILLFHVVFNPTKITCIFTTASSTNIYLSEKQHLIIRLFWRSIFFLSDLFLKDTLIRVYGFENNHIFLLQNLKTAYSMNIYQDMNAMLRIFYANGNYRCTDMRNTTIYCRHHALTISSVPWRIMRNKNPRDEPVRTFNKRYKINSKKP